MGSAQGRRPDVPRRLHRQRLPAHRAHRGPCRARPRSVGRAGRTARAGAVAHLAAAGHRRPPDRSPARRSPRPPSRRPDRRSQPLRRPGRRARPGPRRGRRHHRPHPHRSALRTRQHGPPGRDTVNQVTPPPHPTPAARVRLVLATGLGVSAIAGGVLLAAADVIRGSVTWAHHSPASAAPLFLIATAIAAVSIGRPPQGRHGLLRLVAVLAFAAWGTGQVVPSPAAAGAFNDAAILLFVIDAGAAVMAETRGSLAYHRHTAPA